MNSFGDFIRKRRESAGLLLREVASRVDVDPSILSRIERNWKRPSRDLVVKLASALNVDEDELIVEYLTDKIVYDLVGEELALTAVIVAEGRIRYMEGRRRRPGDKNW